MSNVEYYEGSMELKLAKISELVAHMNKLKNKWLKYVQFPYLIFFRAYDTAI